MFLDLIRGVGEICLGNNSWDHGVPQGGAWRDMCLDIWVGVDFDFSYDLADAE